MTIALNTMQSVLVYNNFVMCKSVVLFSLASALARWYYYYRVETIQYLIASYLYYIANMGIFYVSLYIGFTS